MGTRVDIEAPQLRSGLEFSSRYGKDGHPSFLLRDPVSGRTMELPEDRHFLCRMLNGRLSVSQLRYAYFNYYNHPIEEREIEGFIRQLAEEGFLEEDAPGLLRNLRLFETTPPETWRKWKLFDPSRFLEWLSARLRWCYTVPFAVFSILLFLLALGTFANNFRPFMRDLDLLGEQWSAARIFLVAYLCINFPGEIARGVSTAHFGGTADSFGIWLAYHVMPRFYCWTRVWELQGEPGDKARRAWVIFTPTCYSLLVVSAGMLLWKMTSPAVALHRFGVALVLTGTIDTVIRINVLWPMEGYYLLSNTLEIPDFGKRSVLAAKAWILRRPLPEQLCRSDRFLFVTYGLLTAGATSIGLALVGFYLCRLLITSYRGAGALLFLALLLFKYRRRLFSGFAKERRALP